ncbi:MAG: hypothetical protein ABIG55_02115 [Candidatus Omnitrophota bacterium]
MRCKTIKSTVFCIVACYFFSGVSIAWDISEFPHAPKKKQRASLRYQPRSELMQKKYPLTVGVMDVSDKRATSFFLAKEGATDEFFQETIADGISEAFYLEMKKSGLFEKVVKIDETRPEELTAGSLSGLREQYNVDMLVVADLSKFNMVREKMGGLQYNSYITRVDIELIAQLIYLKAGVVVWADVVDRISEKHSETGALRPGEVGELTTSTMGDLFSDMKVLIAETGKVMKVK